MTPKWVPTPERRVPRPRSTTSEPSSGDTNSHEQEVPSDTLGLDAAGISNTMTRNRSENLGVIDSLTEVYQQVLDEPQQLPSVQVRRQSQGDGVDANSEARRQRVLAILERALEVCRDGNIIDSAESNSENQ